VYFYDIYAAQAVIKSLTIICRIIIITFYFLTFYSGAAVAADLSEKRRFHQAGQLHPKKQIDSRPKNALPINP